MIPGFGHAVLRNTDPRYMLERETLGPTWWPIGL